MDEGGTLTITGSILTGNSARPGRYGGGSGGGLFSTGEATLTESTISGNSAERLGGGIANDGTVTIRGATVHGNTAGDYGGGIQSFGTLTVTGSTIVGNATGLDGGGISNAWSGQMTLETSIVQGNSAGRDGGGIANFGRLTLAASTLAGNSAGRLGGGLANETSASEATLTNVTISGNSAGRDGGGVANLGGLTLTHATLTANRADNDGDGTGRGGGISNAGMATLSNSIVSGNRLSLSGEADNLAGAAFVASSRGNLVGSGEVSLDPEANLVGVDDPRLGPLAFNGGPTMTHALLPGSLAIDAALEEFAAEADQRGVSRPRGSRADIGAFELKTLDVVRFALQGGQRQRSFIRTIELDFANGLGLLRGLIDRGGVRLMRYGLDGSGPGEAVDLDDLLAVRGNTLVFDFGVQGLGGNRNQSFGDGYYVIEVDTDGDGSFETTRSFHRLLGDVDGDGTVGDLDLALILDGVRRPYTPELDVNGDGVVNAADRVLAGRNRGKFLDPGLHRDA
ncbi:dockerin type I repeat-containing protein [Tautonia plasticadhaerens]|uniref:Pectate lyase C n=1 Tax=Tautonia plasticadhaerens TaxID=2527974 RepID=A0A518H6F6_9BACT|nr:dockerin type I repeat-containing protein [Tautonia plasticadhaerens]QDV36432.1 hypothetical protein ElP_43560 [Tautonia plasticadhaerens]